LLRKLESVSVACQRGMKYAKRACLQENLVLTRGSRDFAQKRTPKGFLK